MTKWRHKTLIEWVDYERMHTPKSGSGLFFGGVHRALNKNSSSSWIHDKLLFILSHLRSQGDVCHGLTWINYREKGTCVQMARQIFLSYAISMLTPYHFYIIIVICTQIWHLSIVAERLTACGRQRQRRRFYLSFRST